MRYTDQQNRFARGCVIGYLDTKDQRPHTASQMAKWATIAARKTTGENVKYSSSKIVAIINELRDEGYLITRDVKNNGYRCVCGKRNATPDILGIMESQSHEKQRLATSMENNIVKPMMTIQHSVISNIPLDQAVGLINELRKSDNPLEDALSHLRSLHDSDYRIVPARRLLDCLNNEETNNE